MKQSELFIKYLKRHKIYDEFLKDFNKESSIEHRIHESRPILFRNYLDFCDEKAYKPDRMLDNAFYWDEVGKEEHYCTIYEHMWKFNFTEYNLKLNKNTTVL